MTMLAQWYRFIAGRSILFFIIRINLRVQLMDLKDVIVDH